MRCDFAEWRGPLPTTNFRSGPTVKQGMVHHVIVGSVAAADSEFHRAGAQLSAHFGVADGRDLHPDGTVRYPDGHLVQWVDTDDVSYAQVNGNSMYLSVETAGDASTPFTDAQIVTLGHLDAWAAQVHRFPLVLVDHGGAGLTTHCHYPTGVPDPSYGGHPCPGLPRVGQMPLVLAAAAPKENLMRNYVVVTVPPPRADGAQVVAVPGIPFSKTAGVTLKANDDGRPVRAVAEPVAYGDILLLSFVSLDPASPVVAPGMVGVFVTTVA